MRKRGLLIVATTNVFVLGFVAFPVFADNPVDISIVEVVNDEVEGYKPWEDITGAMPGMTYSAIPRVRNDGLAPVLVKVCLSESATDVDGEAIELPANTFGISINGNWLLDEGFDVNDPAAGNCYKYNSVLGVGAMTEPIFGEVTLSSALGNEYENSTFSLHLVADAVEEGDEPIESDEPVGPNDVVDDLDVPTNPDTGVNTKLEPLTTAGYITLSAGLVVLLGMMAYLVGKKVIRRK